VSLTANFDYCVELGIASVRQIFHLAFKAEDRYPHNVGPFERTFSGRTVTVTVRVMDDETDAADLSFTDERHITFSFPFEITAETPDAPDPALSRVTLRVRVDVPALLTSWAEDGKDVLGLSFEGVQPGDVTVGPIGGLPTIDVGRFAAAVHARYDALPHRYTYPPGTEQNVLLLYDDTRDASLSPPNTATPADITVELATSGGDEYLKVTAPIHVDVDISPYGRYLSYGRIIFHRKVERTDTTVTVEMGTEPAAAALRTVVELDNAHPARPLVISSLTPLAVSAVNGFGTITEPAFSESAAQALIQSEVASYLATVRYPVYSPDSGDPARPIGRPVGFLLPADGVLAVLLNRRDDTVEDSAPESFLGGGELAVAVGRAKVDELIDEAIDAEFPDLDSGGQEIHNDEGDATLKELSVVPADAGDHDESVGHLWVTGYAEVHIDCWPDPDASFEGPIYVDATRVDGEEGCTLEVEPHAGDFDIDESCCDVFLDLIIPIVGWVMLAVVESTIDSVGGELIAEITERQGDIVAPIPPVVNGIAEVTGCLTSLTITSRGFILPGEITIRRLDESFEDRADDRDQPRP
jgi:hypothetical protein